MHSSTLGTLPKVYNDARRRAIGKAADGDGAVKIGARMAGNCTTSFAIREGAGSVGSLRAQRPHMSGAQCVFCAFKDPQGGKCRRPPENILCVADAIIRKDRSWPRIIGKRFRVGGSRPVPDIPYIVIPDLIRDDENLKVALSISYLRHSRESGNPERASADPTLGSRFRGNNEDGGMAAPHPMMKALSLLPSGSRK